MSTRRVPAPRKLRTRYLIVEPDCGCVSCASADEEGRRLGAPRPEDNDVTKFIRSLRPAMRNSPGMACGLIRVKEDGTDELLSVSWVPRPGREVGNG